jgi:hypothetical protein
MNHRLIEKNIWKSLLKFIKVKKSHEIYVKNYKYTRDHLMTLEKSVLKSLVFGIKSYFLQAAFFLIFNKIILLICGIKICRVGGGGLGHFFLIPQCLSRSI